MPAQRLKQIIRLADEGLWVLDASGRTDLINERGAAILGHRGKDITGRFPSELGLPELDKIERVESYEGRLRRRDGSERWFSLSATPLLDANGGRDGTLVTLQDITGRKQAEEMLDIIDTRYRSLFHNPHEAVALLRFVLDEGGEVVESVFVDINALFSKALGRPREEIIGRSVAEVLGANTLDRHLSLLREMRAGSMPVTFDFYLEELDAYVRSLIAPVGAEMYILSSLDMTNVAKARHQSEDNAEMARQQAEEIRALMDAVPSAVWIAHDPECRLITGNKAADQMYETKDSENVSAGTSSGLELNMDRRFFSHGRELRPEEMPMQVSTARGVEVRDYEIEVLLPSGRRRTLLGDAIPLFDNGGRVRGSVASFIDISERKRNEQDLAFQAHLLSSVHDAIVALDKDFRIIYWNGMAEDLFGWKASEAMGRDSGDLLRNRKPTHTIDDSTGRPMKDNFYDGDAVYFHKDGHEIYCSAHVRVVRGPEGMISEIVASFRDITESKRAERELQEYSKQLERSNDELQQFAYVASHDLQEPLRMVTLYMDLLGKRYGEELSPQAREYMNIARQGADRMRQLVNDLLQYSRIETHKEDFTTVDMNLVVQAVIGDLALAIDQNGGRVTSETLPNVVGDTMQMKQLLTNLINNAIKFHGSGPPLVEVSASTVGDICVFSVKDNGIGIDPKYQDKLFKMFSRLHTKEEYPGTGIGLAICKKIIERHGGLIWVDSDGKAGSTFFFTLPRPTVNVGD
ncbi:MAG: PAS domain S-box protein [Methanomassiliicoccus sp.]|nr:PAS domain S-box protein [Methanomassiliicoccus sp.]